MHRKPKMKMKEIEILLNAIVHVMLAIVLFVHIDRKCYPELRTKILFIIPLWSLFLGFYYLRNFIDESYVGKHWRMFRIFETITNVLFVAFFYYKNKKLKKKQNGKV